MQSDQNCYYKYNMIALSFRHQNHHVFNIFFFVVPPNSNRINSPNSFWSQSSPSYLFKFSKQQQCCICSQLEQTHTLSKPPNTPKPVQQCHNWSETEPSRRPRSLQRRYHIFRLQKLHQQSKHRDSEALSCLQQQGCHHLV